MGATPAQVANDLVAQGRYFHRRDDDVSRLCIDAAHLIRRMLAGDRVDGRTFGGVHSRFLSRGNSYPPDSQISKSLSRGLQTLFDLRQKGEANR